MSIDFDEHHSGGSSFDSVIRCGPYPQVPVGFKKKKKSPSPESRVPETSSDPPIGSGRDPGRDMYVLGSIYLRMYVVMFMEKLIELPII